MNGCKPLKHGFVPEADFDLMWNKCNLRQEGLHSSTSQLNWSRFWSLKPQQASTSQLNLSRC